ncbi:MAG TPA: response regulator [Verrucomicrobiae bacterium]|nr:response regulator [Verrucomicrobiae bacterium]
MTNQENISIYMAIRLSEERSHLEDSLVMDHYNVSTFGTAFDLWTRFQIRPVRFVITDRRFPTSDFSGLDLARNIRRDFMMPYCYVVMLSSLSRLSEIQDGLDAGVDDYLTKPTNPFQIRSRILVGLRWLQYIDKINSLNDHANATDETAAAA